MGRMLVRPLRLALPAVLLLAVATGPTAPAQAAVPSSPGPVVHLTGSGWGHSVGMSQYGARALAQQGRTADEILQHYYPGTTVGVDPRVPDSAEVRVDLFRNKLSGSQRVDLRSISASSAGGTPTDLVTVDLGGGTTVEIPTSGQWWVSHDPAGTRYVLHEGTGEVASGPGPVTVVAGSDSAIKVLNVASSVSAYAGTYRWGVLTITGAADGVLTPVLVQPLQNYLWGIAEVPSSWEPAALQAQAITARTYAGRRMPNVLSSTPADQAYSGYDKEVADRAAGSRWKAAVDATGGVAVTYQGAMAQTYYSSSHGLGRTEASEDSWAYGTAVPYLRSVDDPYSAAPGTGNPYVSWTATATNIDFARLVGLARVSNVQILTRSPGGAPKALEVSGWRADGERTSVTMWTGGWPSGDTRGAGARIRTSLPVTGGAPNGRVRSQQISSITLAPFTDDEVSVHQYAIAAVAAAGVTTGCSAPALFCPTTVVNRAQMASFLVRARDITTDRGPDRFSDISGTGVHRTAINALARDGIVLGHSDGTYRPDTPVSRAQMASFLRAAFGHLASTGADRFDDIADTSPHRASINTVAEKGITSGCTSTQYCPTGPVTREQMASFLARAMGLGA
jgi:SpoIID/LytB domain protein